MFHTVAQSSNLDADSTSTAISYYILLSSSLKFITISFLRRARVGLLGRIGRTPRIKAFASCKYPVAIDIFTGVFGVPHARFYFLRLFSAAHNGLLSLSFDRNLR